MLYPQGKINIVNISVAVGATLNLALNLILIPKYAQNGAAIATIIAESSVTITQLIIGKKYLPLQFISKNYFLYIIGTGIMVTILLFISPLFDNILLGLILLPIIGVTIYSLILYICKDQFFLSTFHAIISLTRKVKFIKS